MIQWYLTQGAKWFHLHKYTNVINHTGRIKGKTHMIISIDSEKAFEEICYPFMIKTLNKLNIEGTYYNLIKTICDKPTTTITFNRERLKILSCKI
jgi:hypothetical protein